MYSVKYTFYDGLLTARNQVSVPLVCRRRQVPAPPLDHSLVDPLAN